MISEKMSFDPLPGASGRRLFIAGPCSAESPAQVMASAAGVAAAGIGVLRAGVWKPRTMPGSFEGVGEPALEWLAAAGRAFGLLTATEVATAAHVRAAVSAGVDILWVGARTVSNPFAVQEVADAVAASGEDVAVLVKNPLSPDIDLWIGAVSRFCKAGVRRLGAVHRGFSCYGPSLYRNEPLWSIPFELRRRVPGLPLLCDPSHIAGRRGLVEEVAAHAMTMGFDGLIIESHCDPSHALSDAAQQLAPDALKSLMASLPRPDASAAASGGVLDALRHRLDVIDGELLQLLAARMEVSDEIGRYKRACGMTVVQPERYKQMIDDRTARGARSGLSERMLRQIWAAIHAESVARQL